MNKKDFAKLCFNYNKEPNEDLFELWKDNLRCYDEDEIQKAINIIISNDKFFPNLNRFLEVVKDVVSKEELTTTLKIKPEWYFDEITNLEIDEETENIYNDFQNFIKEFKSDNKKDDMNDFIEELRNE